MQSGTALKRFLICPVSQIHAISERSKSVRSSAFTRQDALDLALDEKWSGSEAWTNALEHAINKNLPAIGSESAEMRRFDDRIVHFDGFARKDSANALDYLYWRIAVGQGSDPDVIAQKVEQHQELSPMQESALIDGAERAFKNLIALHGADETSLGEEYKIGRGGRAGR